MLKCSNAGNVPLWTAYCLRFLSVTERLPSLVADLPLYLNWKNLVNNFASISRHFSWLQEDQVFHLLSSLHHDCQVRSRHKSLPARLQGKTAIRIPLQDVDFSCISILLLAAMVGMTIGPQKFQVFHFLRSIRLGVENSLCRASLVHLSGIDA